MSMSNTNKRVKEIRRKTRRKFSSEEKIRIFMGLAARSVPPDEHVFPENSNPPKVQTNVIQFL